MKNKSNKLSRKKFLDILKNYNEFELIDISIIEEPLSDNYKILNTKGHIKEFMKQSKNNNNDKLDLIINQINNINNEIKDMKLQFNDRFNKIENRLDEIEYRLDKIESRLDKLEICPTIAHELKMLN